MTSQQQQQQVPLEELTVDQLSQIKQQLDEVRFGYLPNYGMATLSWRPPLQLWQRATTQITDMTYDIAYDFHSPQNSMVSAIRKSNILPTPSQH